MLLGETCQSCAADCGACTSCGNGVCETAKGENCFSCATDCQACLPQCADGADNDGDGKIDFHPSPTMGDPQCASPADNDEAN
jgi:hypothetical protein